MKKATLALALGLLIGSATTAIAATDTVQATIAKFKFVVNGEQQQLKNDPLVRNGVTYLPVRETAELLGAQVDFKDGTITLGATAQAIEQPQHEQPNPSQEGEGQVSATEAGVIKLQNSEVKILGYEYLDELVSEEFGETYKRPEEVFISIEFEVLMHEEHPIAEGWSASSFLDVLTVDPSPIMQMYSKHTSDIVKPGERQIVNVVYKTGVAQGAKPIELLVVDPTASTIKEKYIFE